MMEEDTSEEVMSNTLKAMWLGYALGLAFSKGLASGIVGKDSEPGARLLRVLGVEIDRVGEIISKGEEQDA